MYLILEIVFMVLQLVLVGFSIRELKKISKHTMYSYKIISLVGIIIFFSVCFLSNFLGLITWPSDIPFEIYHFLDYIIGSFTSFASFTTLLILPFVFLYLLISNVVLVKKEGRSFSNFLGVLLCLVFIIGFAAFFFSYDVLGRFMDVHSYAGYCFSLWFENLFAIIVSYLECLLFATAFVSFKARRHIPEFNKDYLIILGCRMRDDGEPAGLLRKRIDRAIEFAKMQKEANGRDLFFVPSGGQGSDEPLAEAISIKNYLLENHIPKSRIIVEDDSKTTAENFRFSKKKIKDPAHVAFATSNYHVFRSGVIATNAGFKHIEGIGGKSPWYYHGSALTREYIANLNSERRMHIFNVITIIVSLGAIITVGYFLDVL